MVEHATLLVTLVKLLGRVPSPPPAEQVRQRVAEITALADQDALDVLRSRMVEQEVLDILDAPTTR